MLTDLTTWFHDNADERVFRLWKYKKVFTPYEMNNKFEDESVYEDPFCEFVVIVPAECFELPDGDVMIGYMDADIAYDIDMSEDQKMISYARLKDVQLSWRPDDIKRYIERDEGSSDE